MNEANKNSTLLRHLVFQRHAISSPRLVSGSRTVQLQAPQIVLGVDYRERVSVNSCRHCDAIFSRRNPLFASNAAKNSWRTGRVMRTVGYFRLLACFSGKLAQFSAHPYRIPSNLAKLAEASDNTFT